MIIRIELDTIDPITEEDRAILTELAKLQGGDGWNNFTSKRLTLAAEESSVKEEFPEEDSRVDAAVEAKKAEAEKQEAEAAEKQKAEAEKKAAAAEKRKAAAEKKAAAEAEKAAAEVEKASEEPAEEPEDEGTPAALESDGPTLDDAVKLASGLISSGNSAAVKSVLKEIGVRKVGELPQDKIATFIDQLDAL